MTDDNSTAPAEKRSGPGRPPAEIDWEKVGNLLQAGCTAEGIAAIIGVGVRTLQNRCWQDNKVYFSAFSQQKRAKGDDMLRAKQFTLAMEGDKTMLVWLGKNRLGQADKHEVTGKDGGPLQIVTRVVRADGE